MRSVGVHESPEELWRAAADVLRGWYGDEYLQLRVAVSDPHMDSLAALLVRQGARTGDHWEESFESFPEWFLRDEDVLVLVAPFAECRGFVILSWAAERSRIEIEISVWPGDFGCVGGMRPQMPVPACFRSVTDFLRASAGQSASVRIMLAGDRE